MYVYACGGMYITCTYMFVYQRACLGCMYSDPDLFGEIGPVTGDLDFYV